MQNIIFWVSGVLMILADIIYMNKAMAGVKKGLYIGAAVAGATTAAVIRFAYGEGVYSILFNLAMNIILVLAVEDIISKSISNIVISVGIIVGIVTSFFVPDTTFFLVIARTAVIVSILTLVSIKTKQAIGMGDVLCMGIISLCTTLTDFMGHMITGLFFSLIYSVVAMILKKKNMKTEIALLPFLFVGVTVNILF